LFLENRLNEKKDIIIFVEADKKKINHKRPPNKIEKQKLSIIVMYNE